MLDESDIYSILEAKGISYEVVEHQAVFTVEEAKQLELPPLGVFVKNLFLCDDKKRSFYLVTMPFEAHVNLKDLSERIHSRRLRFANANLLPAVLGVQEGSVTPLGILNDEQRGVELVFEASLEHEVIGIHPLVNSATVFLSTDDLCMLVAEHGNPVRFISL